MNAFIRKVYAVKFINAMTMLQREGNEKSGLFLWRKMLVYKEVGIKNWKKILKIELLNLIQAK